ncbi:UNVERIFIED_CONTAM: hypothetical protein FKN15_078181 [Acipenser sinensis]
MTLEMESIKELIAWINRNTAAQIQRTARLERWTREMGWAPPKTQEREPTELERLMQEWEQASAAPQLPEPRGSSPRAQRGGAVASGAQRGGAVASGAQRGGAADSGAQRGGAADSGAQRGGAAASGAQRGGGEKHTSTTAPTTTPRVQSSPAASSPSPLAPGHPAGLPGPPCAGTRAQERATLATALPLVPCSALPNHPDVAGLLPDIAITPPVCCFASPG